MNNINSSLGGLTGSFDGRSTWSQIVQTVQHPQANPTVALVLVALAAIAALILVLLLLMLLTPARKRVVKVRRYTGAAAQQAEAAAEQRAVEEGAQQRVAKKPSPLVAALTGTTAIVVIVAVAFIGMFVTTSTNAYCSATCHAGSRAVTSAKDATHARCVSCHEGGGILGVPAAITSRLRMAYVYSLQGMPKPASRAIVHSRPCLGCHQQVKDETTVSESGIRMSHRAVISAGRPCVQCHATTGHAKVVYTASMSTCVPCHDSKTASSECRTCHVKNVEANADGSSPERKLGSKGFVYPAVRAANRECGACHNQEKNCDPCHGIRMPHTRGFKRGLHARNAAFEKKLTCWKCHDPQWCSNGGCHQSAFSPLDGSTTHGKNWRGDHTLADFNDGCVCHTGRGTDRTGPICTLCHEPDHSISPPAR
jgi:hypothetical protein